jgi:hypothetical protein
MATGNAKNKGNNEPDYYSIIAGKIVGTPDFLESLLDTDSDPERVIRAALGTVGILEPPPEIIIELLTKLNDFKTRGETAFIFPRSQMYLADKSFSEPEMI